MGNKPEQIQQSDSRLKAAADISERAGEDVTLGKVYHHRYQHYHRRYLRYQRYQDNHLRYQHYHHRYQHYHRRYLRYQRYQDNHLRYQHYHHRYQHYHRRYFRYQHHHCRYQHYHSLVGITPTRETVTASLPALHNHQRTITTITTRTISNHRNDHL
nr:uncharacterized histidine-rich protein DDB_G0274557-like [Penaeus vannamei]